MKYCFCLFLLLSFCVEGYGQKVFERPDYAHIEKVTTDPHSPYYYPVLLKRYEKDDTSLTLREFNLLYYGSFFCDAYNAMGTSSDFNDSVRQIFSKTELSDTDRRDLQRFTLAMLSSDPFNLRNVDRMYQLYRYFGDTINSNKYRFKLEQIGKTLFATGDGLTDTTGIHVLSINDEYAIIDLLGYESDGNQTLTSHPCDYLTLKENNDGIAGLYFDLTQIFKGYGKLFKPTVPGSK